MQLLQTSSVSTAELSRTTVKKWWVDEIQRNKHLGRYKKCRKLAISGGLPGVKNSLSSLFRHSMRSWSPLVHTQQTQGLLRLRHSSYFDRLLVYRPFFLIGANKKQVYYLSIRSLGNNGSMCGSHCEWPEVPIHLFSRLCAQLRRNCSRPGNHHQLLVRTTRKTSICKAVCKFSRSQRSPEWLNKCTEPCKLVLYFLLASLKGSLGVKGADCGGERMQELRRQYASTTCYFNISEASYQHISCNHG